MDLRTHILRWERDIEENPAILVLIIIVALAIALFFAMFLDGYLKKRKKDKHRRG